MPRTSIRLALLLLVAAVLLPAADYTALDRYVAAPDTSYRYQLVRTARSMGTTVYQLDLVSQNWLTPAEVNRPEWHHWLTIIKPDKVTTQTALLYIDGGSNSSTPDTPNFLLVAVAAVSGSVLVQLSEVPNEPLRFAGESSDRSEDAIVAYSWKQYLNTGDERWPIRLPMTKAGVRAMDAATSFLAGPDGGGFNVRNFIVAGGSKRGWTTWSVAAVDPRVIAIAPMVIDILNMDATFTHHWRAYGFWAPALHDYVDAGIMNWFGTPQMAALETIEDPYKYRERMTLPKYMINSAGDQFFLPDSSQFAFKDLPGEKYLRYIPNTDHYLSGLEAPLNLLAWAQAIVSNYPRPRFYWTADRPNGTISLRVIDRPSRVVLWQAANPNARDFRLETIGPAWMSSPVEGENGIYTVSVPRPGQGWTAFFLELSYPGPSDFPLVFTTEVVVVPDVYPYPSPFPVTP